jgi:hypothetical protein
MGHFRFRRRIKLLPGVRVNVSKTGASLSVGPRGITTNVSRRGVRNTVGIPGTGLSYTWQQTPQTPQSSGWTWPAIIFVVVAVTWALIKLV